MKKSTLEEPRIIMALVLGMFLLIGLMACGSGGGGSKHKSQRVTLPDTGQTSCYNASGELESCSGTGQDGAFNIRPMSFTNGTDGTVMDNVTGLMWQKCSGGQENNASCSGSAFTNTVAEATAYCDGLVLATYSDWRLPTRNEFMRLVDYGRSTPAIGLENFPNTSSGFYWSSTDYFYDSSWNWNVFFFNGDVGAQPKTDVCHVRCVRGTTGEASFTDNGNGTVTDAATGLIWQKCSAGQTNNTSCTGSASIMLWQDALGYCNGLSLAEHSDWRLPNVKELGSIMDESAYGPTIDSTFFPNTDHVEFWSSTTYNAEHHYAFYESFFNGPITSADKLSSFEVRCVR